MRSARAARLPLELPVLPEPLVVVSDDEPIVLLLPELPLPEVLGVEADEPVEPDEPVVLEPVLLEPDEPLAPIDVPLLLGVLPEELLALGDELLDESLLLGVLELLELLDDGVLEPEAPIVPVEPVLEPEGEVAEPDWLAPVLPLGEAAPAPVAEPELWAAAKPPKARAAAAARVERVILVARMCGTPSFKCP